MGSGKTSIGKKLASQLGLHFVDADQRLEQSAGATVAMIFELEGEAGFRARESQVLAELMQGSDQVIATGGGAVLSAENRELLRRRGFVVYIQVGVGRQLDRLARDNTRPLLADGDRRATLETLAAARGPLYEQVADLVFNTDGLSVASATNRICARVRDTWKREDAA